MRQIQTAVIEILSKLYFLLRRWSCPILHRYLSNSQNTRDKREIWSEPLIQYKLLQISLVRNARGHSYIFCFCMMPPAQRSCCLPKYKFWSACQKGSFFYWFDEKSQSIVSSLQWAGMLSRRGLLAGLHKDYFNKRRRNNEGLEQCYSFKNVCPSPSR